MHAMDRTLYTAAMEGRDDDLNQYADQLDAQFTPDKNTVLHVAAQFGRTECVTTILGKCPRLLSLPNIKGETPLHVAAREGHSETVRALIESAKEVDRGDFENGGEGGGGATKEMLRATNEDQDTALHMAVRRARGLDVVIMLTQEDPEFQHPPNKAEETPLYLAAEGQWSHAVRQILETCTSPTYSGPGGRTALHVAMLRCSDTDIIRPLLDWKPDLVKVIDVYGWTSLHYAARSGSVGGVKLILEKDKSAAYITTADDYGRKTALHIAAAEDNVYVMEEILLHCPDCWEIVNNKGHNVLHVAVDMWSAEAIEFILKKSWASHVINQKDMEGNTPAHLTAANAGQDMPVKFMVSHNGLMAHRERITLVFNNKNMSAYDIQVSRGGTREIGIGRNVVSNDRSPDNITIWKNTCREREREREREKREREEREREESEKGLASAISREKEIDEEVRRMAGTHMIVGTLIATVTFAAGFTMPGGYDGNQGTKQGRPVLIREAAFKAFVVTNTIAVICSISSALLYLFASLYGIEKRGWDEQRKRYATSLFLNLIAMVAMMLAFITGTYAVLAHSLGLAVAVCAIGCVSFLIYFMELGKCFKYIGERDKYPQNYEDL